MKVDLKYVNIFLIFVIGVLLLMNYSIRKEHFNTTEGLNNTLNKKVNTVNSANKSGSSYFNTDFTSTGYVKDSKTLEDMFKSLSNTEQLCDELEKNQKNKELIEQANINEKTLIELADQEKRIEELKRIVRYLRQEKLKRENINTKCQQKSKDLINKDYKLVSQLADQGLLKDKSVSLDVNVSDSLKAIIEENKKKNKNLPTTQTVTKPIGVKCPYMDTKRYIDAERLRGKCIGCDVDSLKKNINYLKKDF
jgi:hypothetical protein